MNRAAPTNVRLAFWTTALVMLIVLWGHHVADLKAQPPADPAPEAPAERAATAERPDAEAESADEAPGSLGELIFLNTHWSGLTFYGVLAVFSIAAMAVALERAALLRRGRVMPGSFVRRLRGLIGRNEDGLEDFRSLCDGSKSPVANILRAGVLRAGRPLPEVEKAMEDAAAREMAAMRSRNRPLSVIGSVAPLIGLLGTVVGMILAFRNASLAGLGKAELLAEGIYLALMTTAAGLTIAIPSLLLVAWFNARVERFMRDIDEALLETMPSFARMENTTVVGNAASRPEVAAAGKV